MRTLPFLIPILTKGGVVPPKVARALGTAMWGYDLTGGFRIGKLHQRLTKDEALAHLPTLPPDRLASAYLYYDARADDARLCLTVARTAAAHGATVATYTAVVALTKGADGRVDGAVVEADGERIEVRCRAVVNAAGVWTDEVRALDEGRDPDTLRPAKGIHLTVPWAKVQADIAAVIPVPKDRRSLFVVPWGEHDLRRHHRHRLRRPARRPAVHARRHRVRPAGAQRIAHDRHHRADILGTWAGLRPLVKSATTGRTADLSRRHRCTPRRAA